MKRSTTARRRPAVHITLGRAARLHRLVTALAASPRARAELIAELGIGLRTFYRELELLRRCGVRIRLVQKTYALQTSAEEAEGRLPFPDPQLSFAEMRELARGPSPAAHRLAVLLQRVISLPGTEPKGRRGPRARGKGRG